MAPGEQRERFAPGFVLAENFRIVQYLGSGGMGEVYEAVDLQVRQRIAIKLIRPESRTDSRLLSLLREEVRQARTVGHPNVCRVFSLETDPVSRNLFVAMELVPGETLQTHLAKTGRLPPAEATQLLQQIASGMDAIHSRQLLHLDLKPGNIMLDRSGSGPVRAVITDFGLARSLAPADSAESTRTLHNIRAGTPLYMSPERFIPGFPLSPAADVYAFGLVAYQLLSGAPPSGNPSTLPPSLRSTVPDLPIEWDTMLAKCLASAPEARFASCGEAMLSLAPPVPVPSAAPIAAPSAAPIASPSAILKPGRARLALAALAVLPIAAAGFFLLRPLSPRATPTALRWYNQGVDAIRDGTYFTAVRALEQSIRESPHFPLAHANLAVAWNELDSPERAAQEMLLATSPSSSSSRLDSRGRLQLDAIHNTLARDFTAAVANYQQILNAAAPADRPRSLVDLGRAFERANQSAEAVDQYRAAIQLDPDYAGAWLRLAVVEEQLRDSNKVADSLQHAESLYQAATNQEGLTQVYYERGAYANREVHPREAEQWLERARQSAVATHNPHQLIKALNQLAAAAYQSGDSATGEKLAQDSIQEAHANNIEMLAGRGFISLGNAVGVRGDFTKAVGYYNEALRIARTYHNDNLQASALYSLGSIGIRAGGDESNVHQVEQALDWFQANRYPREASYCLIALGRYRRDHGDLAGAADDFRKQLDLARANHDDFQTALALSSVESIMLRQERYPEALAAALESIDIYKRLGNSLQLATVLAGLANLYAQLGRFEDFATTASEAETLVRKASSEEDLAFLATIRANALLLAGRPGPAAAAADQGNRLWQVKFPSLASDFFRVKAIAQISSPAAERLTWCQRSRELSHNNADSSLAIQLLEAEIYLQSNQPARTQDICLQLRPILAKRQQEYSLFRLNVLSHLARRQLKLPDDDSLAQASAALQRFRKRFDSQSWERFQSRHDFQLGKKYAQILP